MNTNETLRAILEREILYKPFRGGMFQVLVTCIIGHQAIVHRKGAACFLAETSRLFPVQLDEPANE